MSLLIVLGFTACDNDGDIITTSGADALTLSGSGDVVLNSSDLGALALTLYWNDNGTLTLSDPDVQAPKNVTKNTLQFSATEDFASVIEQLADDGETSMQFTMESLNSIVGRVGLQSGTSSPLYIRIRSVLADNMDAQYSNVYVVNVTPYTIDMTHGYILDASKNDTGLTLGSADSNGIYSGFLGVSGWYNFWLQEGNGVLWGNDGVTGTPFLISQEDSHWNFWYPGPEGCYYTIVNTVRQEWSALHIPTLTVSGDIEGEMIYTRKENKWTLSFNAQQTGTLKIRISGTGAQYNVNTGTDDAAAISTPVAFGLSNDKLTFGTEASDITVNVTATGESTLTLDLNDPLCWTCTVVEGGNTPQPTVAQQLWVVGVDDGISGGWNFDQSISLTNEDNLIYAGAVNINSLWGYRFYTEKDVWTGFYGCGSGDATQGTLVAETESNVPAPEAGLYLVNVSLSEMSYSTALISSVQITGINDDWNLTPMTSTDEAGVFTATIDITASTPWGYKILLNENWDTYFGGSADKLIYNDANNIPFDDANMGSTCQFTVDLCKGTITITKK